MIEPKDLRLWDFVILKDTANPKFSEICEVVTMLQFPHVHNQGSLVLKKLHTEASLPYAVRYGVNNC